MIVYKVTYITKSGRKLALGDDDVTPFIPPIGSKINFENVGVSGVIREVSTHVKINVFSINILIEEDFGIGSDVVSLEQRRNGTDG